MWSYTLIRSGMGIISKLMNPPMFYYWYSNNLHKIIFKQLKRMLSSVKSKDYLFHIKNFTINRTLSKILHSYIHLKSDLALFF